MATHSNVLAWRSPGTGEPGGLPSMGSHRVESDTTEATQQQQQYEDLQDFLELILKKDVLFIIGDWNAKVGSQVIPGVTGKFDPGVQNEAGQRLTEFCQENALDIAHPLQTTQEKTLHMDIRRVGEAYF